MATSMLVIFDNGGGVTLQTATFAAFFESASYAALQVRAILDGADVSDWEGNDPCARIEPTGDELRNGAYRVHDDADIRELIHAGAVDSSWRNVQDFYSALACEVRT